MLSSYSGPAPPIPSAGKEKERERIRHQKMAGPLSKNILPGAARRSSRLLLQDLDNVRYGGADAARPSRRSRTTRPRLRRSGGSSSARSAVERLARVAQAPGLKKLGLAPVLRIRIYRIHMFLGLPDPDPLVNARHDCFLSFNWNVQESKPSIPEGFELCTREPPFKC